MNNDLEHLKLLSIFHYVAGGLAAICSCFPMVYVVIGLVVLLAPQKVATSQAEAGDALFGGIFAGIGAIGVLISWAAALFIILNGRFLARRKRRMFCIVVAGLECLFAPVGTVLGVFTIIVLVRPSVAAIFDQPAT